MFAGSRLLLPVPIYFITLVPKPGMKEGHAVREPSLLRGIAVLRRSGSRKKRRSPVAARSGGAGAKEEQVGRKTRCRAPGSRRGGCRPRGSGGVAPFAWRPKPAAIRHVWGGAGNGGLAAGCPQPEEPPPSARRRMSIGPSTKWRFSTAWYGTVRHGSVRLSSGRFAFPPQFSTAIEWAGLFTRRYNCAASTAVTSS